MDWIAWMAWTPPTASFFVALACTLAVMTWLGVAYPEAERVGVLRIPTTRGDRLFISLITAAVIHLLWIAFAGTDALATLPIGEDGLELSRLWIASGISLATAVLIFRTV
jgi:predicted small integral membrane protein